MRKFAYTASSPRVRLGIVSGRRRQGKTFLLRALAEAAGAFYFVAAEATSADSLREFGAALAAHAGARAPYSLAGWDDALRVLGETVPGGLAIIDEFPYLVRAEPALPSLVQRQLDRRAWGEQEGGTRLLLCGSATRRLAPGVGREQGESGPVQRTHWPEVPLIKGQQPGCPVPRGEHGY